MGELIHDYKNNADKTSLGNYMSAEWSWYLVFVYNILKMKKELQNAQPNQNNLLNILLKLGVFAKKKLSPYIFILQSLAVSFKYNQKNKLLRFTGIAHLLLFQSNLILPN